MPKSSAMEVSLRRCRHRVHLAVLLCGLVLLTHAERRPAELDFDSTGVERIENNDKPDGDEIFNRLTFVGEAGSSAATGPPAGGAFSDDGRSHQGSGRRPLIR